MKRKRSMSIDFFQVTLLKRGLSCMSRMDGLTSALRAVHHQAIIAFSSVLLVDNGVTFIAIR